MLKGIPAILSPELLKTMMEMSRGDTIVLADGNFPAASCARRLIRADGHGAPALLDAILTLFPLDSYVAEPVGLMQVVPGDPIVATGEAAAYANIILTKGVIR
jgi:L-fucose mutarotase